MDDRPNMLQAEYMMRFSKRARYRNDLWRILCVEFFSLFIAPDMQVLDLGCGWGEFINHIQAAKKLAMDLNPDAQNRLSSEVRFLHQDCSQKWQIPEESLDVVFTSNFLEHLSDKNRVEQTIAEAFRCLKPGGTLVCMGPNIKYLPGSYWDFWDHFIPLTELSLSELLKLKGFEIRRQTPRFLPYSMSLGMVPPLFIVQMYLKLPFLWPFFGKQFLVVGEKGRGARPERLPASAAHL